MSVRESDEERKKKCSSSQLGIVAAAVGVGVGAALYYFLSRRPEHPDGEGATSSRWTCEEPQALEVDLTNHSEDLTEQSDNSHIESDSDISHIESDSDISHIESDSDISYIDSIESISSEQSLSDDAETYASQNTDDEWEISDGSVPMHETRSPLWDLFDTISSFLLPRGPVIEIDSDDDHARTMREQRFRKRSWSLEECSICCEVMLKDHNIKTLACAHNFHSACVEPWLVEQQTCPNCRKQA